MLTTQTERLDGMLADTLTALSPTSRRSCLEVQNMDRSTWRVLGVANGDGVEGLESQRAAEVVLDAIGRLWDFKGRVAAQGGGYVVVVEVAPDIDGAEQWGELRAIVEIVNRYGADAAERFFNFDAAPIVAAA